MSLDIYQQVHKYLGNGKKFLVIAGARDIEDTYPASLALFKALLAAKKEAAFYTSGAIPESFYFLDTQTTAQSSIYAPQNIVVSVDILQTPVQKVSYARSDSRLDIHITPAPNTRLEESDVHVGLAKFEYDAIVAVGLDDLFSLGGEFERNASLFYETPIINIDKNLSNERYGEVNLIEPTCSSCSEIVTVLLKKWGEELITKKVATPLLAGIMSATSNFQNARTKPRALYEAAYLVSKKADREEIVRRLFKTKPFSFLKLWGAAMSKLNYLEDARLAWVSITQKNFSESDADARAIPALIEEIAGNLQDARIFVVFWENHSGYFGIAQSSYEELLAPLPRLLNAQRRENCAVFTLPSKDFSRQEKAIEDITRALAEITV